MSFILDALRKSEGERQREAAPILSRAPHAQVRHRVPVWTWILIGILLLALVGLSAAWWRSNVLPADSGGISVPAPSPVPESRSIRDEPAPETVTETAPVTAPVTSGTNAPPPPRLRSINELKSFGPSLPDYRLELLANNDTDPASSYARINGRRYGRGEQVDGGPQIMEIRADGVVLGYAGERFLLPVR